MLLSRDAMEACQEAFMAWQEQKQYQEHEQDGDQDQEKEQEQFFQRWLCFWGLSISKEC